MIVAEQSTFIKLDRNILRWRWWQNSNVLHVFLFLLLNANIEDHEFENETIHRGEVVTSLASIGKSTGLTFSQIRHTISTLKKTGEVTSRHTNRYQVITIVNYDKYQEKQQTKRQTKEQTSSIQVAYKRQQLKNIKKDKNEKNIKESLRSDSPYGDLRRGTDAFRNQSHLLLKADEGTMDDIPMAYRNDFDNFADYWGYRNQ